MYTSPYNLKSIRSKTHWHGRVNNGRGRTGRRFNHPGEIWCFRFRSRWQATRAVTATVCGEWWVCFDKKFLKIHNLTFRFVGTWFSPNKKSAANRSPTRTCTNRRSPTSRLPLSEAGSCCDSIRVSAAVASDFDVSWFNFVFLFFPNYFLNLFPDPLSYEPAFCWEPAVNGLSWSLRPK